MVLIERKVVLMRFTIISRPDDHSEEVSDYLRRRCEETGWKFDKSDFELVLSVGGDGTLLRSIHEHLDKLDHISFVGIHTGTLGFFTDYTDKEIDAFINDIRQDECNIEKAPLLKFSSPQKEEIFYALNEVRIESLLKTLSLDVYIDGEFFEHTTGSGICVSTQAGSTAINRALQGAVIDSGLNVLQLCEIMPIAHKSHHSLRSPYIMKSDRKILVKGEDLSLAHAGYDHLETDLNGISEIMISTSDKYVRFARYRKYSYLKRLKNLY